MCRSLKCNAHAYMSKFDDKLSVSRLSKREIQRSAKAAEIFARNYCYPWLRKGREG